MRFNPSDLNSASWTGEELTLESPGLERGRSMLASPALLPDFYPASSGQALLPRELFLPAGAQSVLSVGTLYCYNGIPSLASVSRGNLPLGPDMHTVPCVILQALNNLPGGRVSLTPYRSGPALAWVTVSDKGALGERVDESGPAIAAEIDNALKLRCHNGYLVQDDIHRLRALVMDLALAQGYDLILTSGGTGLTPRDITPEAVLPILEKRLPGLEQAMMQASLAQTPRGALSRAVCGTIGQSMVITLPGSVKAVRENLAAVLPTLGHGLEKLQGSQSDCGR